MQLVCTRKRVNGMGRNGGGGAGAEIEAVNTFFRIQSPVPVFKFEEYLFSLINCSRLEFRHVYDFYLN